MPQVVTAGARGGAALTGAVSRLLVDLAEEDLGFDGKGVGAVYVA